GVWRLDIYRSIQSMEPLRKRQYDSLEAEVKRRAEGRMDGREFIFLQNGEVTVNWKSSNGREVSKGRWVMNLDARRLSVTIDGHTVHYRTQFLSPDEMILRSENSLGHFDSLYFLKSN